MSTIRAIAFVFAALSAPTASAADLPDTIARIKPSIVGVATYIPSRAPRAQFRGTGFVVGDGLTVVTNFHVLPRMLDEERKERIGILMGPPDQPRFRPAHKIAADDSTDLALLRIEGEPLPALSIGDSEAVREGQELYMIGYPLGTLLGLYATTHRAGVAAIPPVFTPRVSTQDVDLRLMRKIGDPYRVFQLDASAYPGNSGSPLFDPHSGAVLGVVNQVLLKAAKEGNYASGITYAVPASHLRKLLADTTIK